MKKLILLLAVFFLFGCGPDVNERKDQISSIISKVTTPGTEIEPVEFLSEQQFIQWEILPSQLDITPFETEEGNRWYIEIGKKMAKDCGRLLGADPSPMSQKRQNQGFRITKNKENIDVYMMEKPEKKVAIVYSVHEM